MFVKLVLLITFFDAFFHNFFNGFEISVKFCVLDTFFDFFKKNFFQVILVLFSNFEAKRAKIGSKNQKTYLVNVSQISILHPSKGLYSLFSKKDKFIVPQWGPFCFSNSCEVVLQYYSTSRKSTRASRKLFFYIINALYTIFLSLEAF